MRRGKPPKELEENREKWTTEYIEKKKENFSWHGKNQEFLEALKEQTDSHCAFCDRAMSPFGDADEEIEHFK